MVGPQSSELLWVFDPISSRLLNVVTTSEPNLRSLYPVKLHRKSTNLSTESSASLGESPVYQPRSQLGPANQGWTDENKIHRQSTQNHRLSCLDSSCISVVEPTLAEPPTCRVNTENVQLTTSRLLPPDAPTTTRHKPIDRYDGHESIESEVLHAKLTPLSLEDGHDDASPPIDISIATLMSLRPPDSSTRPSMDAQSNSSDNLFYSKSQVSWSTTNLPRPNHRLLSPLPNRDFRFSQRALVSCPDLPIVAEVIEDEDPSKKSRDRRRSSLTPSYMGSSSLRSGIRDKLSKGFRAVLGRLKSSPGKDLAVQSSAPPVLDGRERRRRAREEFPFHDPLPAAAGGIFKQDGLFGDSDECRCTEPATADELANGDCLAEDDLTNRQRRGSTTTER